MLVKIIVLFLILATLSYFANKTTNENFQNKSSSAAKCDCKGNDKEGDKEQSIRYVNTCPDLSKFVLKSSIPPCDPKPDMSKYVLRSSIPPMPDMEKYVLKTSVPACPRCPPNEEPEYTKKNCLVKCSPHFPRSTYIVKPVNITIPERKEPSHKPVIDENGNSKKPHKVSMNAITNFHTQKPADSFYFSGNHYAQINKLNN
jgi:hypothetical protein